jgi:hypothetical protein
MTDSRGSITRDAALQQAVTWRLRGTGTSRKPVTVEVRYDWPSPAAAYKKHVVLDLERPKVRAAAIVNGRLRISAVDRVSGLARVQYATDRRRPRSVAFKRSIAVRGASWVRVIDRAGNHSAWSRIGRG